MKKRVETFNINFLYFVTYIVNISFFYRKQFNVIWFCSFFLYIFTYLEDLCP